MGRQTRQKDAIESVIKDAEAPLLPEEIAELARRHVPGLGMATVYRALKRLQEDKKVTIVELPGQAPRYEPTGKGHHHHFICRQCRRVYDLMACPGDIQRMPPAGFLVESHEITLIGLCKKCNN
jgi:Fur family ferric uptake transcriptional regulator